MAALGEPPIRLNRLRIGWLDEVQARMHNLMLVVRFGRRRGRRDAQQDRPTPPALERSTGLNATPGTLTPSPTDSDPPPYPREPRTVPPAVVGAFEAYLGQFPDAFLTVLSPVELQIVRVAVQGREGYSEEAQVPGSDRVLFIFSASNEDRLEGVFSHVRTQDHARNCDIVQLGNKSCIGAEINWILQDNPDLDHGHEKCDIKDSLGHDHINPAAYGLDVELRVGSVVLDVEFIGGREDAGRLLFEKFGWVIDWDQEFAPLKDPKDASKPPRPVNLLQPFTQYVGSQAKVVAQMPTAANMDTEEDKDMEDDKADPEVGDSGLPPELPLDREALTQSQHKVLGIESEDLSLALESEHSKYLVVEGKKYSKASLCPRLLMSPSSHKVVIRQFCTAGMTIEELTKCSRIDSSLNAAPGSKSSEGNSRLDSKDLVAFLCLCEHGDSKVVAMAVLEIMYFRAGLASLAKVQFKIENLELEKDNVYIVGQVLELEWDDNHLNGCWVWTKKYVDTASARSESEQNSIDMSWRLTVTIPAIRLCPLRPGICQGNLLSEHTWLFELSQLKQMARDSWELLEPQSDEILVQMGSLPKFKSIKLPYCKQGQINFVISDAATSASLVKRPGKDTVSCYLCGGLFKLKLMRNHVGAHLLKLAHGIHDPSISAATLAGRSGVVDTIAMPAIAHPLAGTGSGPAGLGSHLRGYTLRTAVAKMAGETAMIPPNGATLWLHDPKALLHKPLDDYTVQGKRMLCGSMWLKIATGGSAQTLYWPPELDNTRFVHTNAHLINMPLLSMPRRRTSALLTQFSNHHIWQQQLTGTVPVSGQRRTSIRDCAKMNLKNAAPLTSQIWTGHPIFGKSILRVRSKTEESFYYDAPNDFARRSKATLGKC
ncbi:hypothetical protein NMY22_g10766 [Coprinellus aureogranulatus]|nr:hypothetical protein NMY22_g10766 [Coprinellus aureogranulatus]